MYPHSGRFISIWFQTCFGEKARAIFVLKSRGQGEHFISFFFIYNFYFGFIVIYGNYKNPGFVAFALHSGVREGLPGNPELLSQKMNLFFPLIVIGIKRWKIARRGVFIVIYPLRGIKPSSARLGDVSVHTLAMVPDFGRAVRLARW